MDVRIFRFLNDNNLLQYGDTFLHFDFSTFITLNRETINELIPSETDSTKLHKALNAFINGSDEGDPPCIITENLVKSEVYEIDINEVNGMTNEYVLPDIIELIPKEYGKRKSTELLLSDHPSLTITKVPRIKTTESFGVQLLQDYQKTEVIDTIDMISDSDTDKEDAEELFEEIQLISEKPPKFDSEQAKKKYQLKKIIEKMDLRKIHGLDMKILFSIYNRTQKFSYSDRALLCEIIIKEILFEDSTFILHKAEFEKLAKIIVTTFPQESITPYFIKIKNFDHSGNTADRGRLYTAFKKCQSLMKSAGLSIGIQTNYVFQKRTDFKRKATKLVTVEATSQVQCVNKLEQEFIDSRNERLNGTINKSKKRFSTIQYIEKYEILRSEKGYELIMKDAEFLYPNLKGYVSNFVKIALSVIQYASEQNVDDEYVSYLLSYATEDDICDDKKKLLAILLLPYILPKTRVRRREKPVINRLAKLASAVQFIRLFKNREDEIKIYEKIYENDPKFVMTLSNISIKLYGDFHSIADIIVRVGTVDYTFKDPLVAIEVYIKMFLGIQAPYPIYAQHVFYFFEKIAFGMQRANNLINEHYECNISLFNMFNKD